MYPTQLHSYLLWRSAVEPTAQALAVKRYTAIVSLLPATMVGIFVFGWYGGLVILATSAAAFITDAVCHRWVFEDSSGTRDGVWLLTGLLIALLMPPAVPLWLPVLAAVVAVFFGKYYISVDRMPWLQPATLGLLLLLCLGPVLAGILRFNPLNPVDRWPVLTRGIEASAEGAREGGLGKLLVDFFGGDVRRAVPRQVYREAIFSPGKVPLAEPDRLPAQAVYGPRPLDLVKSNPARDVSRPFQSGGAGVDSYETYDWPRLVLGYVPGTLGGSSALALGFGILLLIFAGAASPLVPLFALATLYAGLECVAWLSGGGPGAWVVAGNVPVHLLSGSTLLAIFYLAADPATVPRSALGKVCAGVAFGLIELFLRLCTPLTEGAILSAVIVQGLAIVVDQRLAPPAESDLKPAPIRFSSSSVSRL